MNVSVKYRLMNPLECRMRAGCLRIAVAASLAVFSCVPALADVWFLGIGNDGYFTDVGGLRDAYGSYARRHSPNVPLEFRTFANRGGSAILGDINWLADNARPGDLAFFGYSGHGGKRPDYSGEELAGWAVDSPDETIGRSGNTCTDDQLAEALGSIDSRVPTIAMFDSCFCGGMVGGRDDLNSLPNVYVMMSSEEDQDSYGGAPYSRFTGALIRGISSSLPADTDADGTVTFDEWFDYARDHVFGQNPVHFDAGNYGSLAIVPVPEPATLVLLAASAIGIVFWWRKHRASLRRILNDRDGLDRLRFNIGSELRRRQTTGDETMKASATALALSLVLLTTLGLPNAPAREIGPDAYGYLATDNIPYAWEDISLTGIRTLYGSDDGTASRDLGFPFNFYGHDYSSVSWSTNGLLTFGGSSGQFTNENLATSDGPANLPCIAALWDDWRSNDYGSGVYYETRGTSGSRRFIVQWHNLDGFSSSPSNVTFQAILFEGTNDILLQYRDVYSGSSRDYGASATVGIRDRDGHLNGENLQWSYNAGVISSGQAILYRVPEPATLWLLVAAGGCAAVGVWFRTGRRKQEPGRTARSGR